MLPEQTRTPEELAAYVGKRVAEHCWRLWKEDGLKMFPQGIDSVSEVAAGTARVTLGNSWYGFGNDWNPGGHYEGLAAKAARTWISSMIEATHSFKK